MTNLYFVNFFDGYYDCSDYPVAIFVDLQEALNYAEHYQLQHQESITVEQKPVGVQDARQNVVIYNRTHYDHTDALFSVVYTYVDNLDYSDFIAVCVEQASPMITEKVDFNKLYRLYTQQFNYDETFD